MRPRPLIGPPASWSFPQPVVDRLDNGLTVWSYHLPGQYVVSTALVMDLPLSTEPVQSEGVATICLRGLDEGSLDHPGLDYAARLESLGAQFSGWASDSATVCLLDLPAQWFEAGLACFAEGVSRPALADSDVARLVANRLAELDQLSASGSRLASWELRASVLAPGQRRARLTGGSRQTVAGLTGATVRDFHRQRYAPGLATLIVAGDLGAGNVFSAVERAFAGWSASAQPAQHPEARPGPSRQRLIDRPDAVQADIRLGCFGVGRTDPLWPAFQVACTLMGGSFSSRLNRVLREAEGWTYDVSVSNRSFRQGGLVSLATSTRTEAVAPLLERTWAILDPSDQPFSQAEVDDAINYLVGLAPLSYATADAVVGQAAGLASLGLGPELADAALKAIARVKADQAEQAWRQVVERERLSLVVVGPADQLAQPLGLRPEPAPQL
ncbi:MAG: insulinase family protein [Propionibacteriaceae bacterium]|jgi:predicted Zn-dependent peptidase|nr:insulinase family protein [Propionibacteriaceae bacterium]